MKKNIRGEFKLGFLVYVLIIAAIIYAGYKWGEAKWNYENMKEEITEISKFWVTQKTMNNALIKKSIIDKGEKIGITIYEDDIEITLKEGGVLTMDVYWDTPIKFPGYTYYIEHHIYKVRKRFY